LRDWQGSLPTPCLCKAAEAGQNAWLPVSIRCTPEHPGLSTHPVRLILTLSVAAMVDIGIGRFAYALVLPDMRDSLHWSYAAAGFMNTVNAAG